MSAELCVRDGHQPAARWRGEMLHCFRCQRCGEERAVAALPDGLVAAWRYEVAELHAIQWDGMQRIEPRLSLPGDTQP